MKKLVLLVFFTIITLLGSAQMSSITVIVNYTDRDFMDTVEAKLIRHLYQIKFHKSVKDVDLYMVHVYSHEDWCLPLDFNGYLDSICNLDLVKYKNNMVATYKYALVMQWDSTLTNMCVLGFSKLYVQPISSFAWSGRRPDQIDEFPCPYFQIPLVEYGTFLNKAEMDRLYSIVKQAFVSYVDDNDINESDNSVTVRTITFNKSDSLAQMPWQFWVTRVDRDIRESHLNTYDNYKCGNLLSRDQQDSMWCKSITIIDSSGNSSLQEEPLNEYEFSGIKIAELWSFDTNTVDFPKSKISYYGSPDKYAMRFSRRTISIGLITHLSEAELSYAKLYRDIIWIDENTIEVIRKTKYYPGFAAFDILTNSALYRKLKLRFTPYGY